MDAFFFIDKPTGMTSFDVLREIRRTLGIKKLGHTGTLDPLATGGLLVATGNYTKLIPYVEKDTKTYIATIELDGTSVSGDSDTDIEILSPELQNQAAKHITQEVLETIIQANFLGKIRQVPPKYSALKINGKRALDRVLAGEEIQMQERDAEVLMFRIISYRYPTLEAEIGVSAGTYIRSLAVDLGAFLETGGYISQLRRSKVGFLDIQDAVTLDTLTLKDILDPKKIFSERMFEFHDALVLRRLSDGQRVAGDFPFPQHQDIFLCEDSQVRFVVEYKDGVLHPRKKVS